MDKLFSITEKVTKDEQAAPRTRSPQTCDGDEDRVTSLALLFFIHSSFLLFLLRLKGWVDNQFYIIEKGRKDQQVAPRTPTPQSCDGDEDCVT